MADLHFIKSSFLKVSMVLLMPLYLLACSLDDSVTADGVTVKSYTVSWVTPSEREDGSPLSLSDIGGYLIYYGTVSGDYQDEFDINDGSITSVTQADLVLTAGTYYFVMTAYDTDGRESAYSEEYELSI